MNCWYSFGTFTFFVYCCTCMARPVDVVAWMCATTELFPGIWGFIDWMTIGNAFSFMTVYVQLNCGLKVASQGYPSMRSSFLILVMRNHSVLWILCICTFRLT